MKEGDEGFNRYGLRAAAVAAGEELTTDYRRLCPQLYASTRADGASGPRP